MSKAPEVQWLPDNTTGKDFRGKRGTGEPIESQVRVICTPEGPGGVEDEGPTEKG